MQAHSNLFLLLNLMSNRDGSHNCRAVRHYGNVCVQPHISPCSAAPRAQQLPVPHSSPACQPSFLFQSWEYSLKAKYLVLIFFAEAAPRRVQFQQGSGDMWFPALAVHITGVQYADFQLWPSVPVRVWVAAEGEGRRSCMFQSFAHVPFLVLPVLLILLWITE